MANTSNSFTTSSLTTDFNVTPYYDDYDETKSFYRILYKPGYAVQARELTQSQTMLQKQIHRFGRHIFKEGSLVLEDDENRAKFSLNQIPYVKIRDLDSTNNAINVSDYINLTLTGATSNIKAVVIDALDGSESSVNNKTLYIAYLNGNPTANLATFVDNEVLLCNIASVTTAASNSTGYGTRFNINEGVVFAKEHFIRFGSQAIIAERYSTKANCQIGFNLTEQIVTYENDSTLLDPALESSNYAAPGADRFKIDVNLIRYDYDEQVTNPDFVRLISVNNGVVQSTQQRTQYSAILRELAKRTYDESGDYFSNGLGVKIRENLDTGNNFGYLTSADGGDASKLTVVVEPGTGYVQGFEIGKIVPTFLTIDKGIDYSNVNGQVSTTRLGNYLLCDEAVGPLIHDTAIPVYLYDTAQNRISERKWSYSSQTGSIVGTAKLTSSYYNSGTLGTANGQIEVYLFDINMIGSNTISSNVKSLYSNSGSVIFSADVVLDSANQAVLQDTTIGKLLYYTGTDFTRQIRDTSGNPDTAFTFRKTDSTVTTTGTFNLSIGGGETFPYTTGALSDDEKQEFLVVVTSNASVTLAGTVSNTLSNVQLSGVGTSFTNLNIGDKIKFTNTDIGVYTISSIIDSGNVIITPALSNRVISNGIIKVYQSGDILDLTVKGATGVERTVSAASNTQLSFDLKETLTSSTPVTVTYNASRSSAREASKTLLVDRYVKINCATAGVTGPFNLGISDVHRIKEIRVHTSTFSTGSEGTDVTSSFTIDNGHNEYYVDHAKISPNPKRLSLTASNHLLVKLDYFSHDFSTGKGYFSVDSYPIDDVSPASNEIRTEELPIFRSPNSGQVYDLRNYLDFRPIKTNTAADATTIAGASTNPGNIDTFKNDGVGLRLPSKSKQIIFDFSYYLARKDLVSVSKENVFSVKRGTPSANPITPTPVDNAMTLAVLNITPYPSLSLDYATRLGRTDLACAFQRTANRRYTMRDIGVLKERIQNLEYYVNLNSLEKKAADMQILDENGLDRFKNGIFVDTFADHTLGSTANPDYRISVDKSERSITPIYNQESLYYNLYSNNNFISCNTQVGVATLSYTESLFLDQPYATTDRNIETSVFNYSGLLSIAPPTDNWVDTTMLPNNIINVSTTEVGTTQYSNVWKRTVTGYRLVNAVTGVTIRKYDVGQTYQIYRAGYVGATAEKYLTWYNDAGVKNNRPWEVGRSVSALDYARFEAYLIAGPNAVKNVSWYQGPNISTRIEEDYTLTREGVDGSIETGPSTDSYAGSFVTDASLITYMRPQVLILEVKALLPTTRHYVFFDGENMSAYCTPLTFEEYDNILQSKVGDIFTSISPPSQSEGSDLISDGSGKLWVALRIPDTETKRFTNGNKQVIVTDSRTNADNPTSSAVNNFYASGLNITTQGQIYSTSVTTIYPPLPPQEEDGTKSVFTQNQRDVSCLAYSFKVQAPEGEEGMFITSADVFFSAKDAELGVWFEIREVDAGGRITRNQIPYSEVWYESSDVTTSNDSSVPFNVKFKAPVFLKSNEQYAFIIHTVGINPGYRVYVADINAQTLGQPATEPRNIDLLTGIQYTTRRLTGTLYTTNNNLNWDIVDGVDLKLNLYRAKFDTNVNGEVTLGNKSIEFFKANNITGIPFIGEAIKGNDRLTLSGIVGTISTGDSLVGASSSANTNVLTKDGSLYGMANTGFIVGEQVTSNSGATATVVSIATPTSTLYRFDENNPDYRVRLTNSNGILKTNDLLRGLYSGQTFNVESFDSMRYSVVNFEPQYLTFGTTSINFAMKPVSITGVSQPFTPIEDKNDWYIGSEMALFSRTKEIETYSGVPSNQVKATLRTISEYQSPVLDLNRTHSIFIDNIINNNTTGEENPSGGELINTYISKIVTLAERQDAEDLNVFLTAYRPPGTEIYVWVKILHAEDFEPFDSKSWIPLEYINKSDTFSSLSDRLDFIEYGFKFPISVLTGLDSVGEPGVVEYTRTDGQKFTGFKNFAIKVGLGADNSAVVPRVSDLRAIALQL
jgi:hypothetical protein